MDPREVVTSLVQRMLDGEVVSGLAAELGGWLPRPDCNPTNQC